MIKKILWVLLILLVVIQFIRPDKNDSNDTTYDISKKFDVPENVNHLLEVSCNDCHSNKTEFPWYANVQPLAWWIDGHVQDGKRHLNFSEFTNRPLAIQYHKFEETVEMVEEHEMPLESYTNLGLHPEANLTDEQSQELTIWAKDQMAHMKNNYPADSLVRKRRGPAPTK